MPHPPTPQPDVPPARQSRFEREHRVDGGVYLIEYVPKEPVKLTTDSLALEAVTDALRQKRHEIFSTPGEHQNPEHQTAVAVVEALRHAGLLKD